MEESKVALERAAYFDWLCVQVNGGDPKESYLKLLRILFNHVFYWRLPLDADREADGLELRKDFRDDSLHLYLSDEFYDEPCNVLEVLVALAYRLDGDVLGNDNYISKPSRWFWMMVENLNIKIDDYNFTSCDRDMIDRRIDLWLSRVFDSDGSGSIFPIPGTKNDQRKLEIWNQMHEYLMRFVL